MRVVITVEGGVLSSVMTDNPNIEIILKDFDEDHPQYTKIPVEVNPVKVNKIKVKREIQNIN